MSIVESTRVVCFSCVQCRGGDGACPDVLVSGGGVTCTDDVRADSITGGIRDSTQCVVFSRPRNTSTCS